MSTAGISSPAAKPGLWERRADMPAREHFGLLAKACLLGCLYAVGALLPFWFLDAPDAGVAFFPAAGLTLSALLRSPARTWPLWLVTVGIAELSVDLTQGQSIGMGLGFALANTLEPLVGAFGIRQAMIVSPMRLRQNLAVYVLWGMAIGPLVGGLIGAGTSVLLGDGDDWASIAAKWWLGDALGVLVVATPILAWTNRSRFEARCTTVETGAIVALATSVTVIPAVLWHHPMLYAVLPILVWAAFRGGTRAVSAAGVGIAFAAAWATVTGRAGDLVATSAGGEQLVFVQIFVAVTLLTALILAVEIADRRRIEGMARRAEARRADVERVIVESAELERRRIARETHDIVGHAVSVMLLQAGAARRMLADDAAGARELLESLETVGRDASRDLNIVLALEGLPGDLSPSRGLGSAAGLIEAMQKAGMDVTLDVTGTQRELATIVDWSAFRIVQEALTNVAKHASSARTSVTIGFEPDGVTLVVESRDDEAAAGPRAEGRGLIGMRERAAMLGGEFHAGREGHAFVVRAKLPGEDVEEPHP